MNREELWARLERADYFDWCSAGEVERLRTLYFDGVVEEDAPDFLKARELFGIRNRVMLGGFRS